MENYQVYNQNFARYEIKNLDLREKKDFYKVSFKDKSNDIFIPEKTALIGNYPNPFNPSTTISYDLAQSEYVELSIYNIRGQLVKTLVNEPKEIGRHVVTWNGDDERSVLVSSGIYFYRLRVDSKTEVKKMLLMK